VAVWAVVDRVAAAVARFLDRRSAGVVLGARLRVMDLGESVVLAVPPGGAIVAAEVADALGRPLDLVDLHEVTTDLSDLVVGAGGASVGQDRARPSVADALGVPETELYAELDCRQDELAALIDDVRAVRRAEPVLGRTAVVVDDGLFTNAVMAAGVHYARRHGAAAVIVASPAATPALLACVAEVADETVCLDVAAPGSGVADVYDEFPPVHHQNVLDAIARRGLAAR
jgi:putative phosphoribosyl transferase